MTACPYCEHDMTGFLATLTEKACPSDETLNKRPASLCPDCGEPLIMRRRVNGTISVRKPTDEEFTAIAASSLVQQMRAAWLEMKERQNNGSDWPLRELFDDFVEAGLPNPHRHNLELVRYVFYAAATSVFIALTRAEDRQVMLNIIHAELGVFAEEEAESLFADLTRRTNERG